MPTKAARPAKTPEAAREAWRLFWQIFMEDKRRRWAILSELGISPQQSMAIGTLKPGEPMPTRHSTTLPPRRSAMATAGWRHG